MKKSGLPKTRTNTFSRSRICNNFSARAVSILSCARTSFTEGTASPAFANASVICSRARNLLRLASVISVPAFLMNSPCRVIFFLLQQQLKRHGESFRAHPAAPGWPSIPHVKFQAAGDFPCEKRSTLASSFLPISANLVSSIRISGLVGKRLRMRFWSVSVFAADSISPSSQTRPDNDLFGGDSENISFRHRPQNLFPRTFFLG